MVERKSSIERGHRRGPSRRLGPRKNNGMGIVGPQAPLIKRADERLSEEEARALEAAAQEAPESAGDSSFAGSSSGNVMHLRDLNEMEIGSLVNMAKDFAVENAAGMTRQELIFSIL